MINKEEEERKACWILGAICYIFLVIPIAVITGYLKLENLTLEVVLVLIAMFVGIIILGKIVQACDRFSSLDD